MAKVGSLKLKDALDSATVNDSIVSPTTVYSSEKVVSLIPGALADLSEDATHRTVTDTEKANFLTSVEKAKIQQQIIFTYNL